LFDRVDGCGIAADARAYATGQSLAKYETSFHIVGQIVYRAGVKWDCSDD